MDSNGLISSGLLLKVVFLFLLLCWFCSAWFFLPLLQCGLLFFLESCGGFGFLFGLKDSFKYYLKGWLNGHKFLSLFTGESFNSMTDPTAVYESSLLSCLSESEMHFLHHLDSKASVAKSAITLMGLLLFVT